MDPNTLKGPRRSPSLWDKAARQGEHVCRAALSMRAPWHSTRHWGYHCRKCSLLHLLHFCCCSQWHYAQWPYWDRQGALHTYAFSRLVARQKDGSQPNVKWMKMQVFFFPFFFFLVYMCCIVKSNHASLIAVHWQMPYSAFKFLFFFPPSPTPSWCLFFPVQANWCFLLLGVECWASFNQSHFRHFTQFFTNLYTNGFKSWHDNFEQNSIRRLFMENPLFIFIFSYIFLWLFFFLICPPKSQLNGHKMLELRL